jgi:hypothetical protein
VTWDQCFFRRNFQRFGDFSETGFLKANLLNPAAETVRNKYGLFNIVHIPTNLFFYFINVPQPIFEDNTLHLKAPYLKASGESLTLFISSFFFLYIFKLKRLTSEQKILALNSVGILFILLTYVFYGGLQYGTRYTLDFWPLVFLLLIDTFQHEKFSKKHIVLICFSSLINAYLYTTIWK